MHFPAYNAKSTFSRGQHTSSTYSPGIFMERRRLNQNVFLSLLAIITLVFAWLLMPFSGAIFWAFAFAVIFKPLFRQVLIILPQKLPAKRSIAALLTLTISLVIVILPLVTLTLLLINEIHMFYSLILNSQITFSSALDDIFNNLPKWMSKILHHLGIVDIGDLERKLVDTLAQTAQFVAGQVFYLGQNLFGFGVAFALMLYLLFFFLKDGEAISSTVRSAIPLTPHKKEELLSRFIDAIRATIKGNLAIALVQGALGGIIFLALGLNAPVLWGAVMALLSMFPAGTCIVWLPAAIYLIVTGSVFKGIFLIAYGLIVIGFSENLLRPFLVGKSTQMPDYIVALSTLGGLSLFGLNGFVIGPVIAALFLSSWKMFAVEVPEEQAPETDSTRLIGHGKTSTTDTDRTNDI